MPANLPSFVSVIPGGNTPSPSFIKYSRFCPDKVSVSVACSWKSIIALSKIKYVAFAPTGRLFAGVIHSGLSGPSTIILKVLSSDMPFSVALTTKLYTASIGTSKGDPVSVMPFNVKPAGIDQLITLIFISVPTSDTYSDFKGKV